MTAVSALARVPPAGGVEQAGVVVVEHHQRGRRGGAPVPGVPGRCGPRRVQAISGRSPALPQARSAPTPRLFQSSTLYIGVRQPRAPAGIGGGAEPAAGRPGAAAVEGAVEPDLVAGAAVVDRRPAHRVGVVEVQDELPGVDGGAHRLPVAGREGGVPGVAVPVADGGRGGRAGQGRLGQHHHPHQQHDGGPATYEHVNSLCY